MGAEATSVSPGRSLRLIGLGLALVTLLVYLPVLHHSFIRLDDADYVAANPMVQAGLTWAGVKWAFTTYHANNWHPLTWLSHMLDWQLFGPYAGAHHIISVLLHVANTVLFFHFWCRVTQAVWPAAGIAAWFAWHPLHVESIAWASERKDVLSTLFFVLTMLAYQHYLAARPKSVPIGWTSLLHTRAGGMVVLLFALGLMAKPMLVTLPCVLLLLDFWPFGRFSDQRLDRRRLWALGREKLPLLLLSAISSILTYQAQRVDAVISLDQLSFLSRLGNAWVSYGSYLRKTFWPADLAVFYPLPAHVYPVHAILAALCLLAISLAVCAVLKTRPYLAVGWFWYLGTLVPVIGLLQVGEQAMADRYTYIPLIGIFVMLAYGARDLSAALRINSATIATCGAITMAGCLGVTYVQVNHWRDSESLFRHTLAVTRDNPKAHQILALALAGKGRTEEAVKHFEIALQLAPRLYVAHNDLGAILRAWGRTNEALQHFQAAVKLRPQNPVFQANLGLQYGDLGRWNEALDCYSAAIRLAPQNPHNYFLRGTANQILGRAELAANDFRTAVQRAPDDLNYALALIRLLAADPEARARNGAEAVALAERLHQLTGGTHAEVYDALAMAYAETGQFDRASATISRLLSLLPAANSNAFVDVMHARLKLYQAQQPYRATPAQSQTPAPAPAP